MFSKLFKTATHPTKIEFVGHLIEQGTSNPATLSLTNLTGGLATFAIAGDIVIAMRAFKGANNETISCNTSGYTLVADLYSDSFEDSQLGVFYKVLTSNETSVELSNTGGAVGGVNAVYVFRYISQTNPLDATSTTATGTGGIPNCPAITTATSNSVVVAIGSAAGSSGSPLSDLTAPSGMTNFYQLRVGAGLNNQTVLGIATLLRPTAESYDPPAFGGGTLDGDCSFCAVTIALRKA
jgi:hypothetical protein